jgi:hypothetical protein
MTGEVLRRRIQADARRWLNHYDTQHQCCLIIDYDGTRCSLWCGHDDEHLPHVGDYLPPPIISPLWVLQFRQQIMAGAWMLMSCPLCGARPPTRRVRSLWGPGFEVEYGPATHVIREWEGRERSTIEMLWRFGPCGCEGREVLQCLDAPGE